MRHLAALCLALLLITPACGPKPQPPFPPAPTGSSSPVLPVPPPKSPAPEDPSSPEADQAARKALTRLWNNQARAFHAECLLESRQKDTRVEDIQNALVENLILPLGSLEGFQQVSRGDFEAPEDLYTVGINPPPATDQMEKDQYGARLQESWWRVQASQGEILAYVALAPQGEELRVQTLTLRSSHLGALISRTDAADQKQVARILELIQAGKGDELYGKVSSPGLQTSLTPDAMKIEIKQLRDALPQGKVQPRLVEGWRWFSSEGWTRSYRYKLPGRKAELEMQVNLNEADRLLSGLTWNVVGSQRGGEF